MTALIEHNEALSRKPMFSQAPSGCTTGNSHYAHRRRFTKALREARHSLVVYDVIWGFESKKACRLYEELTPAANGVERRGF